MKRPSEESVMTRLVGAERPRKTKKLFRKWLKCLDMSKVRPGRAEKKRWSRFMLRQNR